MVVECPVSKLASNMTSTSRGWAGFTEDDINKLQSQNTSKSTKGYEHRAAKLQTAKGSMRERAILKQTFNKPQGYTPIPQQAKLSHLKDEGSSDNVQSSNQQSSESAESSSTESQSPVPSSPTKSNTGSQAKNVKLRVKENNSYEVIPSSDYVDEDDERKKEDEEEKGSKDGKNECDTITLDKLQERQKQMEEQNKRRRQLLVQAIADRSRQTQSEAQKLKHIQSELSKLDCLLSTDVSILRDQIEAASQEFNEAQKRYDKAEREFIEAKLNLFNRLERKELLTEHLCRIIEANERRKAYKLSQLMSQLELLDTASTEKLDSTDINEQILPQLASLDEISYTACTTIKDPKKSLSMHKSIAKLNGDIAGDKAEEDGDSIGRKESSRLIEGNVEGKIEEKVEGKVDNKVESKVDGGGIVGEKNTDTESATDILLSDKPVDKDIEEHR